MREFIAGTNEAGQRLDRVLSRWLPEAEQGFLYRMLRKKNITVNDKKADGKDRLSEGDVVRAWFSEETFRKFSGEDRGIAPVPGMPAIGTVSGNPAKLAIGAVSGKPAKPAIGAVSGMPDIVYEDSEVLAVNKPAGLLSQKARPEDVSANEQILAYLVKTGVCTAASMKTFRPGVVNRLDRNTSGLLLAGKTLSSLRLLSELIRSRAVGKYYLAAASGEVREPGHLTGFLEKDRGKNQVSVSKSRTNSDQKEILTDYWPLLTGPRGTLLLVHLITGKTHQIRAHLASAGHALLGDPKYGNPEKNLKLKKAFGVQFQMLHAAFLVFPEEPSLGALSGRTLSAPPPEPFYRLFPDLKEALSRAEALARSAQRALT